MYNNPVQQLPERISLTVLETHPKSFYVLNFNRITSERKDTLSILALIYSPPINHSKF